MSGRCQTGRERQKLFPVACTRDAGLLVSPVQTAQSLTADAGYYQDFRSRLKQTKLIKLGLIIPHNNEKVFSVSYALGQENVLP